MSDDVPSTLISKNRVTGLVLFCALILGWNMALSSRRKYFSGKLVPVVQKDLTLQVNCPGKIEPKVQETVRSILDGPKGNVYVKEGDVVAKDQLLMEIGDDAIRSEVNNKSIVFHNASVEYAKCVKDLELSKRLFHQLAIPKREVENAEQSLERAAQSYNSAKADLNKVQEKSRGVKVFSPLKGVVLKNFIETETQITSGKELFKVAQIDKYIVRGRVDELEIAQISLGQDAVIACDAFAGTEMKGKISWIGAQAAENAFADIQVVIDIIDTKGLNLKANLSAEAKIFVGNIPQAVVIPTAAVRRSEKGSFVLKASRAGWLREQAISVLRVSGGQAVIKEGLHVADSVLVPPEE